MLLVGRAPGHLHLANRDIALRLGIPVTRVKALIHQACVKLGAGNRIEAIFFALKQGEIDLSEILSPDDIMDSLVAWGPGLLRRIADLLRRGEPRVRLLMELEAAAPADSPEGSLLTNRERHVLTLAARGLSNQEIAEVLVMSDRSVATFLKRASAKLGAHRRGDAVKRALSRGEISGAEISSPEEVLQILVPLGAERIEELACRLEERLVQARP